MSVRKPTATSVKFLRLGDGRVLVKFYDDGGNLCSSQVITANAFAGIPLVAFIKLTAMDQGPAVAKKLARIMRAIEEEHDGSDE
jgi:hypothetical protein